jgi:hypothetical protein
MSKMSHAQGIMELATKNINDKMKEVVTMTEKTNKLPESLTLKLEYTLTLEELNEYIGIPLEEITLDVMLNNLRDVCHEVLDYNAIEVANVYDETGTLIAGDE